jgi:uncharacterized protein YciI
MSRSTLRLAAALLSLAGAAPSFAQNVAAESAPTAETRLFAVVYRAGPGWKPGVPMEQQGLRDHFFYLRDLHARGVVVLAGPLGADGGLVLVRAREQAEAERVIAADPAVVSGVFTGEARAFVPRFASDQPFSAVPPGR